MKIRYQIDEAYLVKKLVLTPKIHVQSELLETAKNGKTHVVQFSRAIKLEFYPFIFTLV